jgi:RHS repeat-associated protein
MKLDHEAARSRRGQRRSASRFRKPSINAGSLYPVCRPGVRTSPRTCFEGPFGEVIRATGPMAKANPFRFSTKYQDDETDLLYYGHRYLSPPAGRWLSRDPITEAAGFNSYCFVDNNCIHGYDAIGLWNADVHFGRTAQWAGDQGISYPLSYNIGIVDAAIDDTYPTWSWTQPPSDRNWSWHFNRSRNGNPADDSRLKHQDEELTRAQHECTNPTDSAYNAAAYLGRALHPAQDWVAHGDFNRWTETPSLSINSLHYWHNWDADGGWWSAKQPDKPGLDAVGVDGRADMSVLHLGTTLSNGDMTFWTRFHPGGTRIRRTEQLTKEFLAQFQDFVRLHAKPCGQCQGLFLGNN